MRWPSSPWRKCFSAKWGQTPFSRCLETPRKWGPTPFRRHRHGLPQPVWHFHHGLPAPRGAPPSLPVNHQPVGPGDRAGPDRRILVTLEGPVAFVFSRSFRARQDWPVFGAVRPWHRVCHWRPRGDCRSSLARPLRGGFARGATPAPSQDRVAECGSTRTGGRPHGRGRSGDCRPCRRGASRRRRRANRAAGGSTVSHLAAIAAASHVRPGSSRAACAGRRRTRGASGEGRRARRAASAEAGWCPPRIRSPAAFGPASRGV